MTCNDCIYENVCVIIAFPEAFENTKWEKEHCDHFKNKADFVEIKNMKWKRHYYVSQSLMGGKYEDGWICSVCGKHSYSRKEICDGCNTVMWKVDIQ